MSFENGALGEIATSWSLAVDIGMRNSIELYGSKGTLIVSPTSRFPSVELYTEDLPPELRGWVSPHIRPDLSEPHDYASWPPHVHHYKREVSSYVERWTRGEKPYGPTLQDGRACLEVIRAGYEAAAGRHVVDLPLQRPAREVVATTLS